MPAMTSLSTNFMAPRVAIGGWACDYPSHFAGFGAQSGLGSQGSNDLAA
jgi:hypothetical protein